MPKGALYRKTMRYRVKLSTKHPSETKKKFENSYLKTIIFSVKNRTFYNIPIKIEIFFNHNTIGLKYFADIWFGMFLVQFYRHKWNIRGNENSAMYSKWHSCQFQWRHKNSALSFKYWIDITCRRFNIWIDITSNKK